MKIDQDIPRGIVALRRRIGFAVPAVEKRLPRFGLAVFQPGDERGIERFGVARLPFLAHREGVDDQLFIGVDLLGENGQCFTGEERGIHVDVHAAGGCR